MLYSLLKVVHILLAMVALGANITYGLWISRASRNPEALPFTLRTIKILDDCIANPSYGLLLVTGLAMLFSGNLPITTPWILSSLVLYGTVVILGLLGYTPTLRRQIELAETLGPQSVEYATVARRGTILGMLIAVLVVAIVFLMVTKPRLWM